MKIKQFLFLSLLFPCLCFAEFIGITETEFMPHYRSQRMSMWCWATSAEMVLSYNGIVMPQERIVEAIKHIPVNAPGIPLEMVRTVNDIFKDENDEKIVVSGQYVLGAPLPLVLYNQLKQKQPVILTYQSGPGIGHAVVLTGIEASKVRGGILVSQIHVFDPFPDPRQPPYRIYSLMTTNYGISMGVGIITGTFLVSGTRLDW